MKWDNTYKVLMEYGVALRDEYRHNLIKNDRFTQNHTLIDSVKVVIKKDDLHIALYLQLADYWKYVEYDTRPHFPPPQAIESWIKAKPIIPDGKNGKLPTTKQLSYLIGRKISREGTKGTHDLREAQSSVYEDFKEAIGKALLKDVADQIHLLVLNLRLD